MNRRTFGAGIVGGTAATLSGCLSPMLMAGEETRTVESSYPAEGGLRLTVENENGLMDVKRHDSDEVDVTMKIHGPTRASLDGVSVTEDKTSDELRLTVKPDHDDVSVDFTVRYPKFVSLRKIRSANGSIDADVVADEGATVRTQNGSIDVRVFAVGGDTEIRTYNGSIDASLASDLDATVSASTQHGDFDSHGLDFASANASEMDINGVLGDGTNDLSIATENGSISLTSISE